MPGLATSGSQNLESLIDAALQRIAKLQNMLASIKDGDDGRRRTLTVLTNNGKGVQVRADERIGLRFGGFHSFARVESELVSKSILCTSLFSCHPM